MTDNQLPTKPGYYWAKRDGDWRVVEVFDNDDGTLAVYPMYGDGEFLRDFTFGPEIVKPDGLEES